MIMDDLDWSKIDRETKINLFDKDTVNNIRVLYGTMDLDPNLLKVVTSNELYPIIGYSHESLS